MRRLVIGLKLLWALQHSSGKGVRRHRRIVTVLGQAIECDYYRAQRQNRKSNAKSGAKSAGLIVFIHGMNVQNTRDIRLIRLAQSFCHIGYDMLMPRLPSISQLEIKFSQKELVARLLEAVQEPQFKICFPGQRFGLISISFSAGISLCAAMESSAQKNIAAMLLIGCFAKITSVTKYFLYRKSIDGYGRNVLLYNFVKYLHPLGKTLERIFFLSAICSSLKNTKDKKELGLRQAELRHRKEKLTAPQKELLHALLVDRKFLRLAWPRAIQGASKIYQGLIPDKFIHLFPMPIVLVHGETDAVIPVSESILLARKLRAKKKQHRLVVTRLLGHGDYTLNLRLLRDVFRFSRGVGYFLDQLD